MADHELGISDQSCEGRSKPFSTRKTLSLERNSHPVRVVLRLQILEHWSLSGPFYPPITKKSCHSNFQSPVVLSTITPLARGWWNPLGFLYRGHMVAKLSSSFGREPKLMPHCTSWAWKRLVERFYGSLLIRKSLLSVHRFLLVCLQTFLALFAILLNFTWYSLLAAQASSLLWECPRQELGWHGNKLLWELLSDFTEEYALDCCLSMRRASPKQRNMHVSRLVTLTLSLFPILYHGQLRICCLSNANKISLRICLCSHSLVGELDQTDYEFTGTTTTTRGGYYKYDQTRVGIPSWANV